MQTMIINNSQVCPDSLQMLWSLYPAFKILTYVTLMTE